MTARIVIAGTKSGVGKTTLTTGIMAALKMRGLKVQGFKVGPDYIDPSYHTAATGRPSANLDVWLTGEAGVRSIFSKRVQDADIAVIEGVMGLFDGNFEDGSGSTAHVAKLLQAPVILVLDCRSMGQSAAAHVLGFKLFDPDIKIAGVILNQVGSERHGKTLQQKIEEVTGIPVVGIVKRDAELALPSRHLGLIPTAERGDDTAVLASKTAQSVDIDKIVQIAKRTVPQISQCNQEPAKLQEIRWAVAQDEAFSFVYPDSLEELKQIGVELVPFSPLRDQSLPPGCHGLLIGGGFPEIYAEALSQNKAMLDEIKKAAAKGLPIYAECGGLMYLTEGIKTNDGRTFPMAGVVPAQTIMQDHLVAMGYVEAKAAKDNLLCKVGEKVHGHVFHYSELKPSQEKFPWAWELRYMRGGKTVFDGYAHNNILASYVHLHFSGLKDKISKLI